MSTRQHKIIPYLSILIYLCSVLLLCAQTVKSQTKEIKVGFHVKWDGKIIPGISNISGFRRVTQVIEHRAGGETNIIRFSPGITKYRPIVLKRPRTNDQEFERWANRVWKLNSHLGSEVSLKYYRKDITIELYDRNTGRILMAFHVYRSWPSEYIPLTDLDLDSDDVAMEVLILHHEGWERDNSIQ